MPTTIDWPASLRPASVDWGLVVPQRLGRSSFDGSAQAQVMGAPRWAFTINTGFIRRTEVPVWEALIDQLQGMTNRLRVWDWRREAPLGVATGTPTVRVAGTGTSLATQGWTPSITGMLLPGSYMGINGELKRLTAQMDTNGSGWGTINFQPPMRASAPVGAAITLVKPTALFVMTTERPTFVQEGARFKPVTLGFEEDPS